MCFCKCRCHTFPVVSARGSKHNVMEVFSESSGYPLLTRAELFMASQSAVTETPIPPIHVILDLEILTQDVAPPEDVPGLLLGVHVLPLFIAMSACLQTGTNGKALLFKPSQNWAA